MSITKRQSCELIIRGIKTSYGKINFFIQCCRRALCLGPALGKRVQVETLSKNLRGEEGVS